MSYHELNHPTPDALKSKHWAESVLIIGSGESTASLIPYKDKIRKAFDVVIGVNRTVEEFEQQMDYHLIVEKNSTAVYQPMIEKTIDYRRDLPRIINWKGVHRYPKDIPIYKTTRCAFGKDTDLNKYKNNGKEGLLMGPKDSKGLSAGTVSMQALHLACIMGCSGIYLIGADLLFKNKDRDHFYESSTYRKSKTKPANRSPIRTVEFKGKTYDTTEFFLNSAKFFDHVIDTYCGNNSKDHYIGVYDFSDGLINSAKKLNIDDFFGDV